MTKIRIAVIEDDPSLGEAFVEVFSLNGHETVLIPDATKALPALTAFLPDIITMDLHMPNVSGFELLNDIRAQPTLTGAKIVIMTADVFSMDSANAAADMALLKPVSVEQLLDLPETLLNLS